ncbi:MAG: HD domain-containing protein [Candidatus Margulisiibacteriota bacterium]
MLSKICSRFRQFYSAMFSHYTQDDAVFARGYLNIDEFSLFCRLPGFEKKHSVVVARRMLELALDKPEFDARKLVRLGLLHDIGKTVEHNSILSKSVLVIIRYFLPGLYDWLADRGEKVPFLRRFYIHKHHGAVGAKILEKLGESSEILAIIAKHDPRVQPLGPDDPIELKLLQQADACY